MADRVDISGRNGRNGFRVQGLTGSWTDIGTKVDWLPDSGEWTFEKNDYLRMLATFREHYERGLEKAGR